jgi:hypothetical protein
MDTDGHGWESKERGAGSDEKRKMEDGKTLNI